MYAYILSLGDLPSQIKSSSTIQICISNSDDDCDTNPIPIQRSSRRSSRRSRFCLNLISFGLKSIFLEQFLIKRLKKMTLISIKRLKKLIKRLKKSIYMEKVEFNQKSWSFQSLFDHFRSNSNFSIKFTANYRFCRDNLKSGFKFGSKKSIQSWFHHD